MNNAVRRDASLLECSGDFHHGLLGALAHRRHSLALPAPERRPGTSTGDLDHPSSAYPSTPRSPPPQRRRVDQPRRQPGERAAADGPASPGKSGVVYTLDRATGEFLWANLTVARNVITGDLTVNLGVLSALDHERLACPSWADGKDCRVVKQPDTGRTSATFPIVGVAFTSAPSRP